MTLDEVLIPVVPVSTTKGIIVQVYLGGTAPDNPTRVHQVYLNKRFRITGTLTGMTGEYFDGSTWQLAFQYP